MNEAELFDKYPWIRFLEDEDLAVLTWSLEEFEPHKENELLEHVREDAMRLLEALKMNYGKRNLHYSIFEDE